MNNKILKGVFFVITVIASPFIAGLYGVLNDQITVTISDEYFTKFKFYQFRIDEFYDGTEYSLRLLAAYVGWSATWWMGIPIGLILGIVSLIKVHDASKMFIVAIKSVLIVSIIALATGVVGLGVGMFFIGEQLEPSSRYDVANIMFHDRFRLVGYMHTFSYLGGVLGLLGGVCFIVRYKSNDN